MHTHELLSCVGPIWLLTGMQASSVFGSWTAFAGGHAQACLGRLHEISVLT